MVESECGCQIAKNYKNILRDKGRRGCKECFAFLVCMPQCFLSFLLSSDLENNKKFAESFNFIVKNEINHVSNICTW